MARRLEASMCAGEGSPELEMWQGSIHGTSFRALRADNCGLFLLTSSWLSEALLATSRGTMRGYIVTVKYLALSGAVQYYPWLNQTMQNYEYGLFWLFAFRVLYLCIHSLFIPVVLSSFLTLLTFLVAAQAPSHRDTLPPRLVPCPNGVHEASWSSCLLFSSLCARSSRCCCSYKNILSRVYVATIWDGCWIDNWIYWITHS
jgi:hypothetical protein